MRGTEGLAVVRMQRYAHDTGLAVPAVTSAGLELDMCRCRCSCHGEGYVCAARKSRKLHILLADIVNCLQSYSLSYWQDKK
jgi:hypothetical protein